MNETRTVPVAAVVVTYNRLAMLQKLCPALAALPWIEGDRIFVVENGSTDPAVLPYLRKLTAENPRFQLLAMGCNTGGAGGFAAGLKAAYQAGFEWFWIMDDDVLPLPGALSHLWRHHEEADAIQVSRLRADGSVFEFEGGVTRATLKRHYLVHRQVFAEKEAVPCQTACFEGMFFRRAVIDAIGFPDADFFICWDDIYYGIKLSARFRNLYIREFCLQKQADKGHFMGGNRAILSSTLFSRYFHVRNFCIVIREMRARGETTLLAWGTFLREFCKALAITLLLEHDLKGAKTLFAAVKHGWKRDTKAARRIFPALQQEVKDE